MKIENEARNQYLILYLIHNKTRKGKEKGKQCV